MHELLVARAVKEAFDSLRSIFNTAYILLASIVGIAVVAGLATGRSASAEVDAAAHWIGVDLSAHVRALDAWVQDPVRAQGITEGAFTVMVIAAVVAVAQAGYGSLGQFRTVPSFILAFAVALAAGGHVGWADVAIVLTLFAVGAMFKASNGELGELAGRLALELILTLCFVFLIVMALLFGGSRPVRASASSDPKPSVDDEGVPIRIGGPAADDSIV